MIKRNMKCKPYKRAKFLDVAWLWVCVCSFGYLFIVALLDYLGG